MVANSYGTMAVQQLYDGKSGLMMALYDGKYITVPGDKCIQGEKRVDITALYDLNQYRPRIATVKNKPMFMY
jgi:6-phosphofructokinase 1